MKLTKIKLNQLIKEELKNLDEAMDFNKRKIQISRIRDGFVGFLEAEGKFPRGEIPESVLSAILQAASITVDAIEAASISTMPGKEAPGEPDELDTDPWRAKMGPR